MFCLSSSLWWSFTPTPWCPAVLVSDRTELEKFLACQPVPISSSEQPKHARKHKCQYTQVSTQFARDFSLICSWYVWKKKLLVHRVLTSMGMCTPGIAGTPVMKSWVINGRSTIDLWQEGALSAASRSKCRGKRTTGIWETLDITSLLNKTWGIEAESQWNK